jgi:ATP-dependent Clp protease protease subunit
MSQEREVVLSGVIGPQWMGLIGNEVIESQMRAIASKGQRPVLRIHSEGGDLLEAMAIYATVQRYDAEVRIESLAASSASYIAMASRHVRIAENGLVMIHDPWVVAIGSASELRKMADTLDVHGDAVAQRYAAKANRDVDEVRRAMKKETWFTAQQALEWGLVDEVGPAQSTGQITISGRFCRQPPPQDLVQVAAPRETERDKMIRRLAAAVRNIRSLTTSM